jgi:hypothetical protein
MLSILSLLSFAAIALIPGSFPLALGYTIALIPDSFPFALDS